jgi:hypothetical protein
MRTRTFWASWTSWASPRALALPLLIAFCLLGCEQPVEIDLPEHEPQLVPFGLFSPDSAWSVSVTQSAAYTSRSEPRPVNTATVEIYEDGALLERLRLGENGIYRGESTRPVPGKTYRLEVSAPGFETAVAESALPPAITPPKVSAQQQPSEFGGTETAISIQLDDDAARADYYALDLWHQTKRTHTYDGRTFVNAQNRSLAFRTSDPVLRGIDDDVDPFGDTEVYLSRAYFDDTLFDGRTETIDLVSPGSGWYHGGPSSPEGFEITERLDARVFSVSEAFGRFYASAEQQDELAGDPFAEPVQIYSNVSTGMGLFAGYKVYSTTLYALDTREE